MNTENTPKTMTPDMKTLILIRSVLNQLMSYRDTKVEINAVELYESVKKNPELRKLFPIPQEFNRFLKKQYHSGLLKQLIPNCDVTPSDSDYFKWRFHKLTEKAPEQGRNTDFINANSKHYKDERTIEVSDGTFVRSGQEKKIYDALKTKDFLEVFYERSVSKFGERKEVDFKIKNKMTQKTFLWEHFGMMKNEDYRDKMTEKIEWYKNNGLRTVENNGTLIYTVFENDTQFQKDIQKYVNLICETNK